VRSLDSDPYEWQITTVQAAQRDGKLCGAPLCGGRLDAARAPQRQTGPLLHLWCVQEKEGGPALARRLVDLYFAMFRMVVEGQVGSAAEVGKAQVRALMASTQPGPLPWAGRKGQGGVGCCLSGLGSVLLGRARPAPPGFCTVPAALPAPGACRCRRRRGGIPIRQPPWTPHLNTPCMRPLWHPLHPQHSAPVAVLHEHAWSPSARQQPMMMQNDTTWNYRLTPLRKTSAYTSLRHTHCLEAHSAYLWPMSMPARESHPPRAPLLPQLACSSSAARPLTAAHSCP